MVDAGIHKDISIEDYHSDRDYLSSTMIKYAKKSLKLFHMKRNEKEQERKSCFDFGNAFELALIDPKQFDKDVFVFDIEDRPEKDKSITSKINQDWKKSQIESHKYTINAKGNESFETIEQMLISCHSDAAIKKLISNIEYQNSFFFVDEETGLRIKTRPDITKKEKKIIVDIKTTRNGSPTAFSKDLVNFDYPIQAIMQIEGCLKCNYFDGPPSYYWLVVEKEPPYSATIYMFDPNDQPYISDLYHSALCDIKNAFDNNFYPGYSNQADNKHGILMAEIPMYYK